MPYAIGVDLGGTKIQIGVVDEAGCVLQNLRLETLVHEGPKAVENQILEGIRYLQIQTGLPLSAVGIGVAGQVNSSLGVVQFAPNLKWHHYPLGANLMEHLSLPVYLINDVRAITWGEWLFGAGKGVKNLICLFVGTGIGAGIVVDNHLLNGNSETCGEVGHMTVDFQGPICECGNRGCLEAFAGGLGISKRAQEAIELDDSESASATLLKLAGGELKKVTTRVVIKAYHEGDYMAQLIIHRALEALIAGCSSLVNAFNPSHLILGGGIIEGLPEWIHALDIGIRKWALKTATASLIVTPAQLGSESGIIGAAAVAFNHLKR